MKKLKILIILFFSTMFVYGQKKQDSSINKINIGLHIGESSGVAIIKPLSDLISLEWNIGINELFVNYNFIDKYPPLLNQKYDNIYCSSINIIYFKQITSNLPFTYRIVFGGQFRVIPRYGYQPSKDNLPPNTIIIADPVTVTKLNFGINYFIGLGYKIKNHLNLFTDVGGYSEITDTFLWTNPQFRVGINYLFIKK